MLFKSVVFDSHLLMMNTCYSRANLNRILCQCLSVGTLTTLSLLLGLAPNLSGSSPTLVFSSTAHADSVNVDDGEVYRFAKAVLAMEPLRLAAYNEIKKISGTPPSNACSQPESIQTLSTNVRDIAVNYCTQSKKIVESNGLDVVRFNQIMAAAQSDEELQKRIQNAMIALQNGR